MTLRVLLERCPQNHRCPALMICPLKALDQKGNTAPTVDPEKCTECGQCVEFCPMGALKL